MPIPYVDLHVHVGPSSGGSFPVAARSDAGEVNGSLVLPIPGAQLPPGIFTAARDFAAVSSPSPEPTSSPRMIGTALFTALFRGKLLRWFDRTRGRAAALKQMRRLILKIDAPEVASLPWEFLFDPEESGNGAHFCLDRVQLIRSAAILKETTEIGGALPLRILGMAVVPADLEQLDVEKEKGFVENALRDLAGSVVLKWVGGSTIQHLQRELEQGTWHVFHFIGHGAPGELAFCDATGRSSPIRASQLAQLLGRERLRLALLNACQGATGKTEEIFSSIAGALVDKGVSAAIGMRSKITDGGAVSFARAFYESLASRRTIGGAVTDAREAMAGLNGDVPEWATPVLYVHGDDAALIGASWEDVADAAEGHLQRARELESQGERERATIELGQAITANPDRADLHLARAANYLAQAKVDPAKSELAMEDLRRAAAMTALSGGTGLSLAEQKLLGALLAAEAMRSDNGVPPSVADVERLTPKAKKVGPRAALAGTLILWVDDHPQTVVGEIKSLQVLGANVETSRNTDDAVAKIKATRPSLVISDLKRDNEDGLAGFDLIRRMRASDDSRNTPVIIYTTSGIANLRRMQTLELGGQGLALQPDELVELVIHVLDPNLEIARFQGIVVSVNRRMARQNIAFEAQAAGSIATYAIDPIEKLSGELELRERRLVEAWAELRIAELRVNRDALRRGEPPIQITALG